MMIVEYTIRNFIMRMEPKKRRKKKKEKEDLSESEELYILNSLSLFSLRIAAREFVPAAIFIRNES